MKPAPHVHVIRLLVAEVYASDIRDLVVFSLDGLRHVFHAAELRIIDVDHGAHARNVRDEILVGRVQGL